MTVTIISYPSSSLSSQGLRQQIDATSIVTPSLCTRLVHCQFAKKSARLNRKEEERRSLRCLPRGLNPPRWLPPQWNRWQADAYILSCVRSRLSGLRGHSWKLRGLRSTIRKLKSKVMTPRERLVEQWHKEHGDITSRLDYPLDKDAIVWDVGGYQGSFASDIYSRFGCNVVIFEPVPEFVEFLQWRFAHNPRIEVRPYGLDLATTTKSVSLADDGTSYLRDRPQGRLLTLPVHSVVAELEDYPEVTLMKLNVEGAEYAILEALLEQGLTSRIRHFQIQFHDFISDAESRRLDIQRGLTKTHMKMWDYPFVWESWSRAE